MPMMCMDVDRRWFHWRTRGAVRLLECQPLAEVARHGFTTRALALGLPDDRAAWAALAATFDLPPESVARLRQVHGRHVVHAAGPAGDASRPSGDALVTDDPSIALAVQAADCVPLLIADRRSGAVAAVHAGWRGTAARAATAAVDALEAGFAARAADLVVAIGPSIGPCCYQVGPEVRHAFEQSGHRPEAVASWFRPDGGDRLRLDLWRAHLDLLLERGVPPGSIHTAALCTAHDGEHFFSYRREGEAAGRLAAVIRATRHGAIRATAPAAESIRAAPSPDPA
jgi:polyphenol oxidase